MIGRLGAVAIGLLLAALLLICIEAHFVTLAWGVASLPHDRFAGFGTHVPMFSRLERPAQPPLYRVSPARLDRATDRPDPDDGRQFLAVPPPNLLRVFVVGGSSAAGVRYPSRYAFSRWLESRVRMALPDLHVEVVNAALSG